MAGLHRLLKREKNTDFQRRENGMGGGGRKGEIRRDRSSILANNFVNAGEIRLEYDSIRFDSIDRSNESRVLENKKKKRKIDFPFQQGEGTQRSTILFRPFRSNFSMSFTRRDRLGKRLV